MNHSLDLIKRAYQKPLSRTRVDDTSPEEYYCIHMPFLCNEYGDIANSPAADREETMYALRKMGFKNVIRFPGPTGALFVGIEASAYNKQLVKKIMCEAQ